MSLLFNMLSRLVKTFLPRSKCLNFMAAVTICNDSGVPKNKVCATVSPSICHEVMGSDAMILVFCMLSFNPALFFSSFGLPHSCHPPWSSSRVCLASSCWRLRWSRVSRVHGFLPHLFTVCLSWDLSLINTQHMKLHLLCPLACKTVTKVIRFQGKRAHNRRNQLLLRMEITWRLMSSHETCVLIRH